MGFYEYPWITLADTFPETESYRDANDVKVRGLISKFAVGCGRNGTDRQYFFVNGRPCAPAKVRRERRA